MSAARSQASSRSRVLVAGGGVAGLEALLALSAHAGERVDVTLISPSSEFVYRPLEVVEPFGAGEPLTLRLDRVVADVGAVHVIDAVRSVDPDAHTVETAWGATQEYDLLLLALGSRPASAIPGALTFAEEGQHRRFAELLAALGRRGQQRLAFAIPAQATWSIAAYELALLTAAERDARRLSGVSIALVTHESAPLEIFGSAASELVASQLDAAGIELFTSSIVERVDGGRIERQGGEPIPADHVVALPSLDVTDIPGIPQLDGGFVETDETMQVAGLDDVWAAGDMTTFPIKQGGLATQQADVAARGIAASAGAEVAVESFRPVLRAALVTGHGPDYLRIDPQDPAAEAASPGAPLWSPAAKLAGRYLSPYLEGDDDTEAAAELVDLAASEDPDDEARAHDRAVNLVLAAADADARFGRFEDALRWLSLVEQLNLVLPPAYVARRHEWRRALDPDAEPDAVARRIDPRFASAAEAISDLQRRVGWLREIKGRHQGEMRSDLDALDTDIDELKLLSRSLGVDDLQPSTRRPGNREGQRQRDPLGSSEGRQAARERDQAR